jgi:hypothetical protein
VAIYEWTHHVNTWSKLHFIIVELQICVTQHKQQEFYRNGSLVNGKVGFMSYSHNFLLHCVEGHDLEVLIIVIYYL